VADNPQNQDDISESESTYVPNQDVDTESQTAVTSPGPSDEELLKEAKARFKLCEDAEKDIREQFVEDQRFLSGDQWPANIRNDRENESRPCLTINRLPQQVQQVTNDQRQNRPAIRVRPLDSAASDETADILEGIVRHVQDISDAEVAYDTAFDNAAGPGLGYFRILNDFASPDSFDQDIFIKRIRNPLSVFFDPYSQELDGKDAEYAFITDDLSPDEYKRQYPDSRLSQPGANWEAFGNESPEWINEDHARVCEYLYKDYVDQTIHLLSTGETVKDEELEERLLAAAAAGIKASVVRSRVSKKPVVKWFKFNEIEILDRGQVPGRFIPIIPVYGKEIWIEGKKILKGIVRDAKDAQTAYNFWVTAEAEAIALAPKAPYVGAEGQFEGHEDKWETANTKNHAYLEYKPVDLDGRPAPPPQRQSVEPAVQAITQARQMSVDDLRATTGVFQAGQGMDSQEVSGIAIQKRTSQIGTANFHLVDNLKHSLKHAGRIIVEWIPEIYDAARAARIIGEDGIPKIVQVNQPTLDESGQKVHYKLNVGRYDTTVDTGPSFASKRQETAQMMQEMARAYPPLMQVAGDIMFRNMDAAGSNQIADRLQKMLPPALQDDSKKLQIPPQAQVQMQQMNALIQQLSQKLNDATKVIETDTLKYAHQERVELLRTQADLEIALAKLQSQSGIELLKQEIETLRQREKLIGMNQPIDAPNDFNPEEAVGGNYAGIGHIGGPATGGNSPGQTPGANP